MKKDTAKRKAVEAINEIVHAAKKLIKAEQAYYESKPREPRTGERKQ